MSNLQNEVDTLARAFAARSQSPAALTQCPDSDLLFEAASGALDHGRRMKIVDHVTQCAECAMAWRLAMDLGARPTARANNSWTPRLALAASVVVAAGLAAHFLIPVKDQQPQYRQPADSSAPTSLTAEKLARDRFLLQWSAGPAGSSYTLRLSTTQLAPLFFEQDITTSRFLVPASVLTNVESGQQLLWQVEIRLPDGRRVVSDTYLVTPD
ncbi:MAG TPA: hypothetical protein VFS58_11310 [Steroidobacteraceae bacterium]|nr:hypothetical protein [Steroidobacteraceae bacterium]